MLELIWGFLTTGPGTASHAVTAIAPLLLMALLGAAKGGLDNRAKQEEAEKRRKYEAETARWSPWTGMKSQYVQDPNKMQDIGGGAISGMSFGADNPGLFGGAQSPTNMHSVMPTDEQENPFKKQGVGGYGPVARGSSYAWAMNNYNR